VARVRVRWHGQSQRRNRRRVGLPLVAQRSTAVIELSPLPVDSSDKR